MTLSEVTVTYTESTIKLSEFVLILAELYLRKAVPQPIHIKAKKFSTSCKQQQQRTFTSFLLSQQENFGLLLPLGGTFLQGSLFEATFQNIGFFKIEIFSFKLTLYPFNTLILASFNSRH